MTQTQNRRGFLRLAAMAPVAAKEAAVRMGLRSGAVAGLSPPPMVGGTVYGSNAGLASASIENVWQTKLAKLVKYKTFGIPEWKRTEMKRNARWSASHLDPDIASMRSLSPSAAFAIMRDRVEDRLIDEEMAELQLMIARQMGGDE